MPGRSNHDVARVFSEMAELLAIKGGDRHRARAFQRVARIVENLPEPVERMLRLGALEKTPGIGEGTVHRVKQILRTGACDDLVRLRAALPPGLRELVRLKGLGASTVRRLHQELRIASVEQLEAAIRSGLLREKAGFSVDKLHALLREIEAHQRRRGKVPLIDALAVTDPVVAELRSVAGVVDVSVGGSLRRRKALIGDLDLLAAADDPEPVVERFVHQPGVTRVLSQGREIASVRLASGQQSDLWVFPAASWGAGLHAFSGSKEHVVAVRTRAGRLGLHVSEHGVADRRDGRRLDTGRFEEEIFAAVGLPFIVPELRENLGEIEAADKGRLPRLIEAADLRGDLHLHTRWSDGAGTIREMAAAAAELGYEYLAVTDHSKSLTVAGGLDERRLAAQGDELRRVEQEFGRIRILAGVEVDVLADGRLDLEPAALRRLDWVVASVHDHFELDAEAMTTRLVRAMESGLVDCIGHPTGRRLGRREPYALDLDRLMDSARQLGVALEVNGDPQRMDLDDVACRQAREMGVRLTIDTDAHSPAHLGRREFGLASARRGWLEPRHVLNAGPLDDLRDHRAARLRRHGILVPVPERPPPPSQAPPAPTTDDDDGETVVLAEALAADELEPALRERLQGFLESGDDPALEAALRRLSDNPVQEAFNRLLRSPPP